jgi:RNA polymerase sigma-70 factor, ECF subfamily
MKKIPISSDSQEFGLIIPATEATLIPVEPSKEGTRYRGEISFELVVSVCLESVSMPEVVFKSSGNEMDQRDPATRFVEILTLYQRDLYTYINTLLLGDSAAADVMQDTNLDLWAHYSEFDFSRPFLPWAYTFAYHRVLAFRKSAGRSRLVFGDDVLEQIRQAYVKDETPADARLVALQSCLNKLNDAQRELIQHRYVERIPVQTLSQRFGGTANQISARLYRIRKILAKCIEARFLGEATT